MSYPKDFSKPFWVFCYYQYYPEGGVNDFIGSYATLGEAKIACKKADVDYGFKEIWENKDGFLYRVDTDEDTWLAGKRD